MPGPGERAHRLFVGRQWRRHPVHRGAARPRRRGAHRPAFCAGLFCRDSVDPARRLAPALFEALLPRGGQRHGRIRYPAARRSPMPTSTASPWACARLRARQVWGQGSGAGAVGRAKRRALRRHRLRRQGLAGRRAKRRLHRAAHSGGDPGRAARVPRHAGNGRRRAAHRQHAVRRRGRIQQTRRPPGVQVRRALFGRGCGLDRTIDGNAIDPQHLGRRPVFLFRRIQAAPPNWP